jgi:hypothetical protein
LQTLESIRQKSSLEYHIKANMEENRRGKSCRNV